MDKYLRAIERTDHYGEKLLEKGHDKYRVMVNIQDRMAGILDVAVMDSSIENDDFDKILAEKSKISDKYFNIWHDSIGA